MPESEKRLTCTLRKLKKSLIEAENLWKEGQNNRYVKLLGESKEIDERLQNIEQDTSNLEIGFDRLNQEIDENEKIQDWDNELKIMEEKLNAIYSSIIEKVKNTAKYLEVITKRANLHLEILKMLNEPKEVPFDPTFVDVNPEGASLSQSSEPEANKEVDPYDE